MSNTDKYTKYEPDLQKTHFDNKDLQLSALSDSNLGVKEAAKSKDDKSEHQAGKIFVKKPFDDFLWHLIVVIFLTIIESNTAFLR